MCPSDFIDSLTPEQKDQLEKMRKDRRDFIDRLTALQQALLDRADPEDKKDVYQIL